jgi:alkylhydroperoxidase family enzyme
MSATEPHRLTPLEPPFPPDIADTLAAYPQQDGYILSLFRTFANSRRFLRKGVPNLLDRESPLPLRIREIVILRVTARRDCAYEWGVHAAIFARAARLDEAALQGTVSAAPDPALWTEAELRLIHAVDAFLAQGRLPGDLKTAFEADWTLEQQLEILALAGAYQTISFVANLADLPPEPFAVPFPVCRG